MEQKKIDRINELARLAKTRELTNIELAERSELRTEYLRDYRAALTGILDNSVIVRPDGSREAVVERKKSDGENLPRSALTRGAAGTGTLGGELAAALREDKNLPRFIALYGDLGAGKTAFVAGFVAELSPAAHVRSPTFSLVNEYPASPAPVFHFDMYRIGNEDELYSTGFYDYPSREGFILTEWSENIPYALPDRYVEVRIAPGEDFESRQIDIRLIENKDKEHENSLS